MQGIDTIVTEKYAKYIPKKGSISSSLSYYSLKDEQKVPVPKMVKEEFETTE